MIKQNLYKIMITAVDKDKLSTTKSIMTTDLYLNNFFKDQPFIDFDTKIQSTLRIFDMTEVVEEKPNADTPISISGSLTTLNGSTLNDDQPISIAILQSIYKNEIILHGLKTVFFQKKYYIH